MTPPGIWPAFRLPKSDGRLAAIGYYQPVGGTHRIEAGCVILTAEEAKFVDELFKRFRWGISTCAGSLDVNRPLLDELFLSDLKRRVRQAVSGQVGEFAAIEESRPPLRGPNDFPRRELTARLLVVADGLPPDPKL